MRPAYSLMGIKAIALAPAPLAFLAAALPAVLVLHPHQLREAAWNGFVPYALPLAVWVGLLTLPMVATTAWALRQRAASGPLVPLALGVGCGLAVIVGPVCEFGLEPACTAAEFDQFRLACERV